MKKQKILFLQPPAPLVNFEIARENTLTAAGYLTAYFKSRNNHNDFEFIIASSEMNDYYGDALLIAEILKINPDALCFSCYCWNISRIKHLTAELKTIKSELIVVYGGPEITQDNNFLLNDNRADILVCGEGENTFEALLLNKFDVSKTEYGLIKKTIDGKYLLNGRFPAVDIYNLQSPYLMNILAPEKSGFIRFETQRGCAKKCSYCYYSKEFSAVRTVALEKTETIYNYALKKKINEVFLLDADFLARKDALELLQLFQNCARAANHKIDIHTELNAEAVTPEIARLMAVANFKSVEVGFQSCNIEKLKLSNRGQNTEAFINGVNLLKENNIEPIVDIIIGLPGETKEDIRRTYDFICRNNLQKETQVFNLAVLPGTTLRENAAKFDIQYSYFPPYYLKKSNTLNSEELSELFIEAEDLFDVEFDPVELPCFIEADNLQNGNNVFYNKCIIDFLKLNNLYDYDKIEEELNKITEKAANNFTLWLKNYSAANQPLIKVIIEFIGKLTFKNPNTVFDYIIDLKQPTDIKGILKIFEKENINEKHYLNHYYFFDYGGDTVITSKKILLYNFSNTEFNKKWIECAADYFYCLPKFRILSLTDLKKIKKHILNIEDILLDTSVKNNENFADELTGRLAGMFAEKYYELIHFTDFECQKKWAESYLKSDIDKYLYEKHFIF